MKRLIIISLCLSAVLAGLGWFYTKVQRTEQPAVAASVAAPADSMDTAPTQQNTAAAQITVTEKVPEPITESFKLLASAYAEELTFPPYSRPLTADDSALLAPNRYIVQTVPLQDGASAAIVLEKYRFSYPEPVGVTLQVDGFNVSDVSVQLYDELNQTLLATEPMRAASGHWSATLQAQAEWNGAVEVQVSFSAGGKAQTLKTGMFYSHPVATITGVGQSTGKGSDMQIPVNIRVEQPGYYRLRANLFTEQRQPLAVLSTSAKLGSGDEVIVLKAYKAVLQSYSGPFVLGSFVLEKRPAQPGEQTLYGDSEQADYVLEYFALGQLSDEPWQPDEDELQRLQFLQQMAQQ